MTEEPKLTKKGKPDKRGGARKGSGRKLGSRQIATDEQRVAISALARQHTPTALKTLLRVCKKSGSDAAAVSAAEALLNRGYGRPAQSVEMTGSLTVKLEDLIVGSMKPSEPEKK